MNYEEYKKIEYILNRVLNSDNIYPVMTYLYNVINYDLYMHHVKALYYYEQSFALPGFDDNPDNKLSLDDALANNIIKVRDGEYTVQDGWLLQKYMRDRHMWIDSDEIIRIKVNKFGLYTKLSKITNKIYECSRILLGVVPSHSVGQGRGRGCKINFDEYRQKLADNKFIVDKDLGNLTKYLIMIYIIETKLKNDGFNIGGRVDYVQVVTNKLKHDDYYKYDYDFKKVVKRLLDKCFHD